MTKLSLPHLNPHNTMDRIIIDPKDIKPSDNSNLSLLHDATNLVTFEKDATNPLAEDWCFALYFYRFDIGITIQRVGRPLAERFERAKMFELGKYELGRFSIPAEFMCPASTWEDYKSPLTKHLVLNHLCPGILISSVFQESGKKSVRVTMSIRNQGPDNGTISTNTAILKLIP